MQLFFKDISWKSDWYGYESGLPEYPIIGYYQVEQVNRLTGIIETLSLYVDVETGEIVEFWFDEEPEGDNI